MSIVTLTLHPALDKSTSTDHIVPDHKLRCAPLRIDAGGGGINVSKGIRKLDGQSTAVFPVGGANGDLLCSLLEKAGIATQLLPVPHDTRESFSVTETRSNQQYRFTVAGGEMTEAQADQCLDMVKKLRPTWLVASGSLPPGLPENYFEKVVHLARQIDAKLILDTSGAALSPAVEKGVFLLKPNLAELSMLAGVAHLEMNEVDDAALKIIHAGKCEVMVVSLGPQGALLVTRDGFEHIPAPMVKKQTTVGAGDSMIAGMVWALEAGKPLREMAQIGVACGSAATMNTGTELFQAADVWRLFDWIGSYGERYRFTDF